MLDRKKQLHCAERFGNWTVIKEIPPRLSNGRIIRRMLCYCICAKIERVDFQRLKSGKSPGCGCLKIKPPCAKFSSIYRTMKSRCYNKNSSSYAHYGGRGITISEKWLTYKGFIEDMFEAYREGLSIERIDVNGNYCLENCKWIERKEQPKNRRNSVKITYKGETKCLSEWAREYNISRHTLRDRLKKIGMTFEEAIKAS